MVICVTSLTDIDQFVSQMLLVGIRENLLLERLKMSSNSSAYEAVVYVASSGLSTIHNSARIYGSGEITTEGVDTIGSREGPLYNYAIGVAAPAIVMILFFIIWGCSLICAKKCCKGCCGKNVALFFFVAACSISLLGWALGLAGNVNTTKGVTAMMDGIGAVQNFAVRIANLTDEAADFSESLLELSEDINVQCSNDNLSFPLSGISDGLNQTIQAAVGDGGLQDTIAQFNTETNNAKNLVIQYVQWREIGTMIVIVVTMVILTIFMVSTALRVMDSTPEQCRPLVRCSSRTTSCVVFIFGILLLLIIWIFVALIHVIVTIGADLCVPSINYNINRLANEVINDTFSSVDPCTIPGYQETSAGILCYYQTCNGTNQVEELTTPIRENSNFSRNLLVDFKTELVDLVTSHNVTVFSPQCFPSMDAFLDESDEIFVLVNKALDLTTCPAINPVYSALLYDGVCNGLFDGLVFTYVSCIIACTFMMFAMSIFRIFDFGMYEYGQLPQAHYVDGKVGDSKGGPITQAV